MARVDLRCTSCGYQFFISDVQVSKPEGVKCPSCLAPVDITGPTAGGPARKPVRVLEAGPDSGSLKMKMWIGIGAGGLLALIGVAALLFTGSGKGSEEEMNRRIARPSVPSNPGLRPGNREGPPRPLAMPAPSGTTLPAPAYAPSPAAGTTPAPIAPAVPAPLPGPAPVAAPAGPSELPADLLKVVRDDVFSLQEWHLNLALSAPEKGRLDALMKAGKGEAADLEFLRSVVAGPRLRAVREEAVQIKEGLDKLEKEALESLPSDKIVMNDGRTLHGKIVDETGEVVKLERKFSGGVGGVMPLPRAGIKEVLKGKGIGGEFKGKWASARKAGAADLASLMGWCKENALPLQASLAAHAVLAVEPGRSDARQEAGFASDPVARLLEAEKQGGYITYLGRRWVPRELKEKLLRDGFALVNGQWFARKERMISVPGLFRYERQEAKPVLISGTGIGLAHDVEFVFSPVQDLASNSFVEKSEMKYLRRFWAPLQDVNTVSGWPVGKASPAATSGFNLRQQQDKPTAAPGAALRGEVYITVPLDAPLLEASVMTAAEVKGSASITVSVIVDGRRERVYVCAPKEDKSHKLPDLIRGKTQVDLVAEFSCTAIYKEKIEKRKVAGPRKNDSGAIIMAGVEVAHFRMIPEYPAVLFPSNSNTLEVFRLTAVTADPAPGIDKVFENAREILK